MYNQQAYYASHRVRFEFRKSQVGNQRGTVYALIYIEGRSLAEPRTTNIRCTREEWDKRTSARASQSAKELNEKLVLWERGVSQAAKAIFDRGDPMTASTILDEKNQKNRPLLTIEEIFKLFVASKAKLVGPAKANERRAHQISINTYRSYEKRWIWLQRYLKQRKLTQMLAMKVDAPFVQLYYAYLLEHLAPSTATMHVRLLTEMCRWAFRAGHLRELKTDASVPGTTEPQTPPYNLTEEEIQRIEGLTCLSSTQEKVRDAFLLARELCLHYADYIELEPSHFSRDRQGRLIIEKYRVKQASGRRIKIIALVSPRAERIWKAYGEQIPSNTGNAHLRRVVATLGEMAGLERRLTFSHARDSGIFRLVVNGCKEVQIKLAAGWTSTRNLIRYVNHDRKLLEELPSPYYSEAEPAYASTALPFLDIYKAS